MTQVRQEIDQRGKRKKEILKGINLKADGNDIIGIVCESELEREALANIFGAVTIPSSGYYFLNKKNVPFESETELSYFRRKNIGMIAKSYELIEDWTVYDNVAMPLVFHHGISRKNLRSACQKALARVGMYSESQMLVKEISLGQRRLVMLARAIVTHPKLLVAQNLLDDLNRYQLDHTVKLITELPSYHITPILLSDHNTRMYICTRNFLLKDGKLVEY